MFFLFLEFNLFSLASDKSGNFRNYELPKKVALPFGFKIVSTIKICKGFCYLIKYFEIKPILFWYFIAKAFSLHRIWNARDPCGSVSDITKV